MYLQTQQDPEIIRSVITDFGYFLKDLAAAGVFPYDLFNIWNYGVTSRGRVVLFDYDDVGTLENATFRAKPAPRDETEELQPDEDRITAMPDDFFVDETERYSGIPEQLKEIFKAAHADLFTVKFWQLMQSRVRRGDLFDVTPYDRRRRFTHHHFSG
jgi:isocitrate dehydrogenase kinase/phosphatase